ncbi:hypothetical protein CY35_10G015600 [Sphagnum magellanicum]|nr:hypothetical protein CY35_10G015600 [Sphagnum magellanicum]
MGLQAHLVSQALCKMSDNAARAGCTLIFLNEIWHKLAVMYRNPEVMSGGLALKLLASLHLEICNTGCTRKLADELLLRSSKNGTAFVTAVLMKRCLVKKSWGYKSQMILCPGIGNENAKEFAFSKIACINLHGKRHGLYKQISNMCC